MLRSKVTKTVVGAVAAASLVVGGAKVVSSPSTGTNGVASVRATVPGVADPNATKAKICTPGYTATIRPPASYTTALKIKQLKVLGYKDQNPSDYEEDHLISLEIGGSPTDPNNLWPELWNGAQGAHVKDQEENLLHSKVCAGTLTIAQAQAQILADWGPKK